MNNNKKHDILKMAGKLYSSIIDGYPKGILNKTIAHAYAIILITIFIVAGIIGWTKKTIINWKSFIIYIAIGSIFGWSWNYFTVLYDPNFPGWLYHPWSIIGLDLNGMVFEDFVFYIACGGLFWMIRLLIPNIGNTNQLIKCILIVMMSLLTVLAMFIFTVGGISIAMWFAIPGIAMIIYSWKKWNVPRFLITGAIIVLFGAGWDIISSNVIPNIKGMAWAAQWMYISYDQSGIPMHSSLWMPYINNRWAWIGNIPVEILIWFNVSGWWFIYGLSQMFDKKTNSELEVYNGRNYKK